MTIPKVLLIDGYIDDPAALGVPPYISPMIRAAAGAAIDAGASVEYVTIDQIRRGKRITNADVNVVLAGNTVPGKYLRSMPASLNEIIKISSELKGWKMIGGSAADSDISGTFDFCIRTDLASAIYDGITGKEVTERLRNADEWNRWMLLGADIVTKHQDFPIPLIAEVETYRGCHRYRSGGCSYCIEPLKGKPLMRDPEDVISEISKLTDLGIRNVRIGGQTCIISYGSTDTSDTPRPAPDTVSKLFTALKEMDLDVLHVDNANPAVISKYPEESSDILTTLTECCTPGNVLALGMESADPNVIRSNNLNSTPEQVMDAIKMINRIGSIRGDNGMPLLLPGINLIAGLDVETKGTYDANLTFLKRVLDENLMVRRINVRQVMPIRKDFSVKVDRALFKRYKQTIREDIDRVMLQRIVPKGTVLKNVYLELNDGNVTFGRQIGSYPLLIGIPYPTGIERFCDVIVTDWGFRSITGMEFPFRINDATMTAISSLPGIGKKRAAKIILKRPYSTIEDLRNAVDDPSIIDGFADIISFERNG